MLVLREPDGNEVTEPSLDYLASRVLDGDLAYWEGPAGDAGLFFRDDGRRTDLLLIVQAEGCLVTHRDYATGRDTWVAQPPEPAGRSEPAARVEVYDGENLIGVAPRFLVPRELAWQAVEAFVATGEPAPGLRWETELEMDEPA